MPNTREKLIELFEESLRYSGDLCGETGDCKKCQYNKFGNNCGYAARADYLIRNGVGFVERDCHWATEQAYKNGYENGKPKWIPVTERLPEKNTDVLIYNIEEYIGTDFLTKDGKWFWNEELPPTHWMPLPQPPKET